MTAIKKFLKMFLLYIFRNFSLNYMVKIEFLILRYFLHLFNILRNLINTILCLWKTSKTVKKSMV